jgi:hypothetical protein
MKGYHYYFYILKFIILLLIALMSLKIIPVKNKIFIIIDFIFKISLGLFIIIFFLKSKNDNLYVHDRLLFIMSGFILILLIDYIQIINVVFNKHIPDERCIQLSNEEEK